MQVSDILSTLLPKKSAALLERLTSRDMHSGPHLPHSPCGSLSSVPEFMERQVKGLLSRTKSIAPKTPIASQERSSSKRERSPSPESGRTCEHLSKQPRTPISPLSTSSKDTENNLFVITGESQPYELHMPRPVISRPASTGFMDQPDPERPEPLPRLPQEPIGNRTHLGGAATIHNRIPMLSLTNSVEISQNSPFSSPCLTATHYRSNIREAIATLERAESSSLPQILRSRRGSLAMREIFINSIEGLKLLLNSLLEDSSDLSKVNNPTSTSLMLFHHLSQILQLPPPRTPPPPKNRSLRPLLDNELE